MTTTVLSDWFLLEIALIMRIKALRALIEFRRILNLFLQQLRRMLATLTSIEFWRFLPLVLKRVITIIKKALDYFPNALLESFYILHFLRAFLTIINYCKERNKSLVEISKLLLAITKVMLALVMLTFIVVALVHGVAPLGLAAYGIIKTLFSTYTFTKFSINFASLGYSAYRRKIVRNDLEHAWLREQYYKNMRKHREILLLGVPMTTLLLLLSFMGVAGLGPVGFIVVMSLGCSLLVVDILKSIYYFHVGTKVAEPQIGSLKQENSLIGPTLNDYYFRKCRIARLSKGSSEDEIFFDKIYLLKEIIVKIIQLDQRLKKRSYLKFGPFYSEKTKILEKRNGLIQDAAVLLDNDIKINISLFSKLYESFLQDRDQIENSSFLFLNQIDKGLYSLEAQLKETKGAPPIQKNHTDKPQLLYEILSAKDTLDWGMKSEGKPKTNYSNGFFQSIRRKVGDCEDIHRARCALSEKAVQSLRWAMNKI